MEKIETDADYKAKEKVARAFMTRFELMFMCSKNAI
jgi:hypothetical protein